MVPIFVDASSAILLEKAGLFDLFSRKTSILFSRSVFKELTQADYPDASVFKNAVETGRVLVHSSPDPDVQRRCSEIYPQITGLDRGEKETICLYFAQKKGFILVDDGKAARICDACNFPFINALLVPKLFWYTGHMDKQTCASHMSRLGNMGRYSEKVKAIAQGLTQKELSFFLKGICE